MKILLSLSLLLVSFFSVFSQTNLNDRSSIEQLEDTLGVLSYAIINAENADQRFIACHSFIPKLISALKEENSFDYPFDRLKSISIQYPQDSSFRVFTWQLYVDSSQYRYYGAIQLNTPDLKLIPLQDRSFQIEDVEYAQVDNKQWYGALYYNIIDFDTPEGKKYLLFGYDAYTNIERYEENTNRDRAMAFSHNDFQQYTKRKLIDVLTLKDGKAIFGSAVFTASTANELPKKRVVLEYSAESKIVCNYDEFEQAIIFDHLMSVDSELPDGRKVQIPDGTFEGYKLSNGQWKYIPKMFNTIVDEAPRDTPVLDKGSKDILGRKKG